MSIISTRLVTLQDLEILQAFEQEIIETEKPMNPFLKKGKITFHNIEELITLQNTYLIVAVLKEEVIGSGYIRIEKSRNYHKNKLYGHIGFMYIKLKFRGQKVSHLILDDLKNWAKSKNVNELRLEVYSKNTNAIKTYEKFGFEKSLIDMRIEI